MDSDLLALARPVRGRITLSVGLGLLITAGYVGQGVALAMALASLLASHAAQDPLVWLAAFVAIVVVRSLLIWWSELAAQATGLAVKADIRGRLAARLLELGPGYALRRQTGELHTTLVAGVEALENYFSRYLPAIFIAILGCLAVLLTVAAFDLRTAAVLALFVIAAPVADALWMRWRMPSSAGIFTAMGAFAAYLIDSTQGVVTLKAFHASARRRDALVHRAANLRSASMRTLGVSLFRGGITGFITLGGVAVVLAMNAWRVAEGELAVPVLFVTLFLAREAFRPLDRLEREFHTAWAAKDAAPPIAALLAEPVLIADPADPVPPPAKHELRFDGVSFAYDGASGPALSDISFDVAEGEFVALVGPSGAGKSTLFTLLLRFHDPDSGAIRIGGVDIRRLPLEQLRAMISVVSQDIWLMHGTVEDNLRIARASATTEEIEAAARAAQIHDFIADLPQGYRSAVGERGALFSGGQRQRIAIARALLKDAPILLLDEATSSVDPAGELAIRSALESLVRQRTTLVIAHRLSTIRRANRILVLDGGRIVEQGDHDTLARTDGAYARLLEAQGEAA